jgi:hydrogenase-4 component F
VALYALIRFKVITDGALGTPFAGPLLMGFGLLSVAVAAFFLSRQRDIKRMFAYSSIEHMGIITFAFGMGGPVASFAGLLHMTVHSLTKSAIFFAVGHAAQKSGTQLMENIRGLVTVSPTVGWGLMLGTVAILGMPPSGVNKVQSMVFGEPTAARLPHRPALVPVFAHLALVLLLGLYIPPYLADWYRRAAQLIG